MDIATQTETVTTTTKTFIVKLTEAELTAALVDAKPLQRELRKARNAGQDQHSNWATNGHAPRTATAKVKRGRPAKAEKKNTSTLRPSQGWRSGCAAVPVWLRPGRQAQRPGPASPQVPALSAAPCRRTGQIGRAGRLG